MRSTEHGLIGRLRALDPARSDQELGAAPDDLVLRRIISSPREGTDEQLVPRRPRGPVAAASIAALAVLGAGAVVWFADSDPAYASWTPEPEPTSVTSNWPPAEQCPDVAHEIDGQGADVEPVQIDLEPVLVDVRGDYTYQLSTDGSGAYAECFVSSDEDGYDAVTNDVAGAEEDLYVPDVGITVLQSGTTAWSEGNDDAPGALTAAFGRTADAVQHVLLTTEDGQQVNASVENGWWAAWAPGQESFIDEVVVIDADGQRRTAEL